MKSEDVNSSCRQLREKVKTFPNFVREVFWKCHPEFRSASADRMLRPGIRRAFAQRSRKRIANRDIQTRTGGISAEPGDVGWLLQNKKHFLAYLLQSRYANFM